MTLACPGRSARPEKTCDTTPSISVLDHIAAYIAGYIPASLVASFPARVGVLPKSVRELVCLVVSARVFFLPGIGMK